jgi:hypothetical protein
MGQTPGEGVEADDRGKGGMEQVEEEEGDSDRFSMECAMVACELDGLVMEMGGVDGGGESDPNRGE